MSAYNPINGQQQQHQHQQQHQQQWQHQQFNSMQGYGQRGGNARDNYGFQPEEQKVQGRQVIITYDDDDEVVHQGRKRFNVNEEQYQKKNIQEGRHGKKHFQVENNFNRTEVQLPKGKAKYVNPDTGNVKGTNDSSFMSAISRDHLDGKHENRPNRPKKKTPRPVLLPGESIRHNPTHNSAEQSFHFSKQGDTARWRDDLPKKDLRRIQAEKRRPNVMPGEANSYEPTFNSNISTFQMAISRDDFDGKAEMPQKEVYLKGSKNSKQPNVRPGEALRYEPKSHAHHNNPLGHIDSQEWAKDLPNKFTEKKQFEPKFPPPRKAHQFSVQLGSDQASYPKGKYLDDRGKINGKDPKEYTSLRYPVTQTQHQQMDPTLLGDGVTPYSIKEIQQRQNQDGSVVGSGVQRTLSRSSLGAAGYKMMSNSQGGYGGYGEQQGVGAQGGQEKNFNYGVYNGGSSMAGSGMYDGPTAQQYSPTNNFSAAHNYHAPSGTNINY